MHFIENPGTFGYDNFGSPISYTLRFTNNNAIAQTKLSTEYVARNCQKLLRNVRVHLDKIYVKKSDDGMMGGSDLELEGRVQVNFYGKSGLICSGDYIQGTQISLSGGDEYRIDKNIECTFSKADLPHARVEIKMAWTEIDDYNANDKLRNSKVINLTELGLDSPVLNAHQDGQEVEVFYRIDNY